MHLSLYCLGGGGVNIGKHFEQFRGADTKDFAKITPIYVDTSKSNLRNSVPMDSVYLISDVDGSGKKRDCNYQAIAEAAPEILHRHKPTDINILVHTASGGSGGILGSVLASMMLERGEKVIVLLIGSRSSQIELENTVKTLKSYEAISQKRKKPVVMFYRENSTAGRSQVDSEMKSVIPLIAAICSGNNAELDSEDIGNFLNYQKVTKFDPTLVSLDFFSGKVNLGKDSHLVSAVTLVDDNTFSDIQDHLCPYQAVGFIEDSARKSLNIELPLHACVISGSFHEIVKDMEQTLNDYTQAQSVLRTKSIGNVNDADELGMVI